MEGEYVYPCLKLITEIYLYQLQYGSHPNT